MIAIRAYRKPFHFRKQDKIKKIKGKGKKTDQNGIHTFFYVVNCTKKINNFIGIQQTVQWYIDKLKKGV